MSRRRPYNNRDIRADVRNLVKISGSHYLSIPPKFIEAHNLKAGDPLPIAYDGILMVTPIPSNENILIPSEEILLPYPEGLDTEDEDRLSVLAFVRNYVRIHDYTKQEKPDWEKLEVTMETVVTNGKRFFKVTQIINKTPAAKK